VLALERVRARARVRVMVRIRVSVQRVFIVRSNIESFFQPRFFGDGDLNLGSGLCDRDLVRWCGP
jgi:hypothetical protein